MLLKNKKKNNNFKTIIQSVSRYNQNSIPRFCYYQYLVVSGNCRMCLIDVKGSIKPVAACASPFNDSLKINLKSPLTKKARENILEFILLNHPLDCLICEQGGRCELQENAEKHGSDLNRNFRYARRSVVTKKLNGIIKGEFNRCIHCECCTRFYTSMTGKAVLGTIGRSWRTEIDSYFFEFLTSELSGNIVDRCPVSFLNNNY